MERSVQARLGCLRGQLHAAMARLKASHERAHAELAAVQAQLLAVLGEGWIKAPLGQIKAPGDQSIRDHLDRIQAEVQGQVELTAGWEAVRADWDTVQAAWEEMLTDTQVKAAARAPSPVPANTAQTLFSVPPAHTAVARLQASFAKSQASCADAQMEVLQAQRKSQLTRAVTEPVLKEVYERVATAVHDILMMAMQDLEMANQAQRLPLLSQLTRAVHAQVEMALRGILARAMREVAAADRGQLAKALCSQVAKAVQDVIVKAEQDWGQPMGAQLEPTPGRSKGRGQAWPGGEAAL